MAFPKVYFRICETRHCPVYRFGDIFSLSGIAIDMDNEGDHSFINTTVVHSPPDRQSCKILFADLSRIIIEYERADQIPDCMITCSGCTGSVRLEHFQDMKIADPMAASHASEIQQRIDTLSNSSFFRHISRHNLHSIGALFTLSCHSQGDILLRKGDPANTFFVIARGEVEILNDAGIAISRLGPGEVFGEMSLICNDTAGATVQAKSDCELLCIGHRDFREFLQNHPSLQLYFARLLARRLSESNRMRAEDFSSGMIGKLEEIPPEALFQTLNVNGKTGILTITQLSGGTARFSLRQGALIKASYNGLKNEQAFYEILRKKKGRFKFTPGLPPEDFDVPEIGYFMKLLMEGMQRLDERCHPN